MRHPLHNSDDSAAHVSRSLAESDPAVREALDNETRRQRTQVEFIASENIMSRAVREALGHEMGNKTLEGYPGNRFHGGGEYVDVVESLAIRDPDRNVIELDTYTGTIRKPGSPTVRTTTKCIREQGIHTKSQNKEDAVRNLHPAPAARPPVVAAAETTLEHGPNPRNRQTHSVMLRLAVLAMAWALAGTANAQVADGELRLVDGDGTDGNGVLEIYHNNEWGIICDDFFDQPDAEVACRQLGYDHAESYSIRLRGHWSRRIWLDDLLCNGTESRLADCHRRRSILWGAHNCNVQEEAAGVTCGDTVAEGLGVHVGPQTLSITEGEHSGTYRVRLQTEPTGTVTVTPTSTNAALSISPTSLTFTTSDWNLSKPVQVTAAVDDNTDNGSATITHTVAGADYDAIEAPTVAVIMIDPNSKDIVLSKTRLVIEEEDSAGVQYTVLLNAAPTGNVTVTIAAPDDAPVTISPTTLTFTTTNWDTPQTVTVTVGADDNHRGETYTVSHTATGGGYDDAILSPLELRVNDNDRVAVRLNTRTLTIVEGNTLSGAYTVVLDAQPNAPIAITASPPSGSNVSINPATVTFTTSNWNTPQSIQVTAANDADSQDETIQISHSASGTYADLTIDPITVQIKDDENLVKINTLALSLQEGEDDIASYTLRLNVWPTGAGTVTVHIDADAKVRTTPTQVQFTQSNWNQTRTVRVTKRARQDANAVDERVEIRHLSSDGQEIGLEPVIVTIIDDEEAGVSLSDQVFELAEGERADYSVQLTAAPLEPITLTITGMEDTSVAVSPTSLEFTPSNWNRRQTVSVEATQDLDFDDESITLRHELPSTYFAGAPATIEVRVDDDEETTVLHGPPTADTVWWATIRIGENGGQSYGYQPANTIGYLSDPDFEYAGASRTVDALYYSDGTVHLWMDMGNADALPNSMVLHVGTDVLDFASARHIDLAARGSTKRQHWYRWSTGQHDIDWNAEERVGIWLEGPRALQLPDAPTGLTATPVPGGVQLDWQAPSTAANQILEYEYQQRDSSSTGGRYWWGTESTATTYTVKPVRAGRRVTFRVRAVNTHGNGTESPATPEVSALAVNHPPTGVPRVTGRAVPGQKLKANVSEIEDPNGTDNAEFQYQWKRSDGSGPEQPIPGANTKSYRVQEQDQGTQMKVAVSFTDDSGFNETVESKPRLLEISSLIGRLNSAPDEHDGTNTFTMHLRLNTVVDTGPHAPRAASFEVTGGTIEQVQRIERNRKLWEISIRPLSDDEIVIAVPLHESCGETGAICTADGRVLSNASSRTIPGPLSVSVADAHAEEGVDQALRFLVTLSRAVDRTVTVDYQTVDGTAHAGSDYEAASGTLDFEPGETERVVIVAALDDAVDEGEEIFVLVLRNPSGVRIGRGQATGTIENTDSLQTEWLARFGRTVAHQVVDTIGGRFDSSARSHVTIAGHELGTERPKDGEETAWSDPEGAPKLDTLSGQDAMLRSAFQLSSAPGDRAEPVWTAWGRIARSSFASNDDELALKGDVTSTLLGLDAEAGDWLAGAALAHNRGDGSYTHTSANRGEVSSTLTSVHPYVRKRIGDDVMLWGIAGYGTGTLTLADQCRDGTDAETGIEMKMAAAGVRGTLLKPASTSDLEIGIRSDVTWSKTRSEAATSVSCGNLEAARVGTIRTRLAVDGARTWELNPGRTLTPSLELGLRHDEGDAETGLGLEAGARLRYLDAATGVALEAGVRRLLVHEDDGYEAWGASAAMTLAPDRSGRGFALRIAPSWGSTASEVERLWLAHDTARFGREAQYDNEGALQTELSYGVRSPLGRGIVSPYAGLQLTGNGDRTWRIGGRWKIAPAFRLTLEGTRTEEDDTPRPSAAIMVRTSIRW